MYVGCTLPHFVFCCQPCIVCYMRKISRDVLHSIQMPSFTKEFERMFISFSEIIVTRDMD